jgi:hypothetical protein
MPFAGKWMEWQIIVLSEISQVKYSMFSFISGTYAYDDDGT